MKGICLYIVVKELQSMTTDKRYTAVQGVIETGKINRFREIFDILPKSVMAQDLGQNYRSFVGKVGSPERFTMKDVINMGRLIDVAPSKLVELILSDV